VVAGVPLDALTLNGGIKQTVSRLATRSDNDPVMEDYMDRRTFIERIAALVGVGLTGPQTIAAPVQRIELQRSPVAGFQYHEGDAVWSRLRVGERLDLIREEDNPYDLRAVRVEWRGHQLGYVPRLDNAAVSQLLDNGQTLRAEIAALQLSRNPWERIAFTVYMNN